MDCTSEAMSEENDTGSTQRALEAPAAAHIEPNVEPNRDVSTMSGCIIYKRLYTTNFTFISDKFIGLAGSAPI